jgi:hypothetical protein
MKTIILTGGSPTDQCFTLTTQWGEEITWNITRIAADAEAGKFGAPRYASVADLPPADWSNWGASDRATVDWFKTKGNIEEPCIAIGSPNPNYAMLCFADGQHRATARQELGLAEIGFYLVPWDAQEAYRVTVEEVDVPDLDGRFAAAYNAVMEEARAIIEEMGPRAPQSRKSDEQFDHDAEQEGGAQ